ncbi:hypothetical protein [Clostridium sp. C2-6-12]|uniref:hypothetical protein n=1 Tax=Clostridium sp. C2-6-12 TaxID=2698832 RepID=UPI0013708601|nr:hypothetical protein [Clostridium sp. C2-6-12]
MRYIVSGLAIIIKEDFIKLEVYSKNMSGSYLKNNIIFGVAYGYVFQVVADYKIYGMKKAKAYTSKGYANNLKKVFFLH